MRLKRPGRPALAIFLFVAVVLVPAWALLSTEWGTRTIWPLVEGRLPEGLSVGRVSGRLRSPLALEDVRYVSDGVVVDVGSIHIRWRIGPLLRRVLDVTSLEIDDVDVRVNPATAEDSGPPPMPPAVTLPLTALVDQAVVRRVSVTGSDGTPVALDSIDVGTLSLGHRFTVGSLTAVAPTGRLHAAGWVEPAGDFPLFLEMEVQGTIGAWEPLDGHLSVSGDLSSIAVTASVTRPLQAEASMSVDTPRYQPTFQGRIVISHVDAVEVRADLPPGAGSGTFDLSGNADSIRIEGSTDFETPQTGPVSLVAALVHMDSTLHVENVTADILGARLGASGTVILAEAAPVMDLNVGARRMRWPLDGPPEVRVDTGWVSLRGTSASYTIVGGARGARVGGPSARMSIRGSGTAQGLDIADLRVNTLDGLIQTRGAVAWDPEPSWDLQVVVEGLDPTPLLPDSSQWGGLLTLAGRTAGRLGPEGTDGDFVVHQLSAALASGEVTGAGAGSFHLPLSTSASATGGPTPLPAVSLDSLDVQWGPNSLWAAGIIADSLDLDLRLSAPDLAVLHSDLRGELDVTGSLTGSRAAPRAAGRILGRQVGYLDQGIDVLGLRFDVDTDVGGIVAVEGLATGLTSGNLALDSLALTVEGTPERHSLVTRLAGSRGSLDLEASGGVTGRAWNGQLHSFDFGVDPLGNWALDDTLEVALSQSQATLSRGCWRSGASRACAEGSWEAGEATTFEASIRDMDLERLQASLPEDWLLSGSLTADASVRLDADSTLAMSAIGDFGSGRISFETQSGRRELYYSDARVQLITDSAGTRGEATLMAAAEEGSTVAELDGHVELPNLTRLGVAVDSQALSGRLDARISDFSALESLLTAVEDLTGELDVDLAASGTLAQPELEGEAHLRGVRFDVPRLGMELRDAELTAVGMGREGISVRGRARSGPGSVEITGGVPAAISSTDPIRLQVTGEDFLAVDVPEVSAWVSPNLDVVVSTNRVDLTGTLLIPRARVEVTETSSTGISPSLDVVFVDDTASTRVRGPEIHTAVRIVLGDSVTLRGFGLTAQPRGSILATDAPGRATTATGEITITGGRYRAYGQSLEIERGRVVYAGGPVDNPGLDIRATRRARDGVVAGLEVRGTLREPDASIFSEPTMLQSDALAYIVLGRSLGTASASEGSAVADAATSLGIRGGNVLAGRIAQRFGLAEVRIEAEGPLDAASLIAGKYLSPRLYVSYGVGLFEPINTFRMRYQFSRLWTLQAETGRATSADLMYRIEGGR